MANTKVFWHPYTDDSPEAEIDVSGWSEAHIIATAARVLPKAEDCHRLDEALDRLAPFHDPKLGCIRYSK